MRFLLASVTKDLRRGLADLLGLSIWIGFPVLLGVLVSLIFGGGQEVPAARVWIVNQDDSLLSGLVVRALEQAAMGEDVLVEFDEVDLATGRERIRRGDGTALLILPPNLGTALLEDEPATLTLITNPAEAILPSILIEGLEIVRDGAFYAQRVLGEPLREIAELAPGRDARDSAVVASLAAAIYERLRASANLLDPPLFSLDFDGDDATAASIATSNAASNEASIDSATTPSALVQLILPGLILMSILFIAQAMSADLWAEKEGGTLGRAVSLPGPVAVFIGAKLIATLLVIFFVAAIALTGAALEFGVPPVRILPAVLWCTFAGAGLCGLFLLVTMLATSHHTANLITMMILFPLMMIGGSVIPFDLMPDWARAIGAWTPNGMAVERLDDLLYGAGDAGALVASALAIAAVLAVTLWLCTLRARPFVTR